MFGVLVLTVSFNFLSEEMFVFLSCRKSNTAAAIRRTRKCLWESAVVESH